MDFRSVFSFKIAALQIYRAAILVAIAFLVREHHLRLRIADGKKIAAQNVGAYIWDSYKSGEKHFYNNAARDNLIGWAKGDERNDWWTPDAASFEGLRGLAPLGSSFSPAERMRFGFGRTIIQL